MKKLIVIFEDHDNSKRNVKISNYSEGGWDGVEITVNSWMDHIGGCDGETCYMSPEEFEDFISSCQELLAYMKGAGK
jgi:hypothetical protein